MFPKFLDVTRQFPHLKYAVAQLDYLETAASDVTHTPTFSFFKGGQKVDQIYGTNEQQLEDHLWLWQSHDEKYTS